MTKNLIQNNFSLVRQMFTNEGKVKGELTRKSTADSISTNVSQ